MSIEADRIRAETLAKIQNALVTMDIKIAKIPHYPELDEPVPDSIRLRMARTAMALDIIRKQVSDAFGERERVPERLLQLCAEIVYRAGRVKKTLPRPTHIRLLRKQENEKRSLWTAF